MAKKTFPLGTVLSITTGYLLAPNGIGGVYEILNFMTEDDLFTHQLPRVSDEVKPYLFKQFPQLEEVGDVSEIRRETLDASIAKIAHRLKLPMELEVETLPPGEHYHIEPISELAEKVHPSRIHVIVLDAGEGQTNG